MGNANKRMLKLRTSKSAPHPNAPSTPVVSESTPALRASTRWSDIAAGRKSTHPDTAPVKRILDVFELTEHVLKSLPVMDSLRARAVCRTFRDVFNQSPTLLHAAFLKADPSLVAKKWVRTAEKKLLTGERAIEYIASRKENDLTADEIKPLRINPVAFGSTETQSLLTRANMFISKGTSVLAPPSSILRAEGPLHTKSSVGRMFLTQPPTTKIRMSMYGLVRYPEWEDRRGLPKFFDCLCSSRVIENEKGVTVEEIRFHVQQTMYTADRGRASLSQLIFLDGLAVTAEEADEIEEKQRTEVEQGEESGEEEDASENEEEDSSENDGVTVSSDEGDEGDDQ